MLQFLLGFFVGGIVTLIVCAACTAAGRADRPQEQEIQKEKEHE